MAALSEMDSTTLSRMSSLKSPNDVLRTQSGKSVSFSNPDLQSLKSNEGISFGDLRPSLANQVRVGYFSMDRACQTEHSEIINLKETTELLRSLVEDVTLLKKNLYYAKLALQADYDSKIENRSLELYSRTNNQIKEIEKIHEERVKIVRHSFRTQLADAIKTISKDYHRFYSNKGEEQDSKYREEMERIAKLQEEERQEKLAQQEMIEMMQLQMSNEEEEEDVEEDVAKSPSTSSEVERHAEEIRHLTDMISNLEDRIEEYEDVLDSKNQENLELASQIDDYKCNLLEERDRTAKLNREIMEVKLTLEIEKKNCREQIEMQKEELQRIMEEKIEETKMKASAAASKKISELESLTKSKEDKLKEQMRIKESQFAEKNKKLQKDFSQNDYSRLKEIEKQQQLELSRLKKELERSNKTWEMKVTILQQTMHALKDEMFLRTSLRRQSAKLQHAAITYASNSPVSVSAEIAPSKPPSSSRKYQLPSLVQGPRALSELATIASGVIGNNNDKSNDTFKRRPGEMNQRTGTSSDLSLTRAETSSQQTVP